VWSPFFFVGFVVCATFGILNLIIGVITERTAAVQREYRDMDDLRKDGIRMKNIEKIADIMFSTAESAGDDPNEATISKDKMLEFINSEAHGSNISNLIRDVKLPVGYDVTDCHAMFDRDATGTITQKEFVEGMGRLIFSNEFQRSCMVQSGLADVMVEMKAIEVRLCVRLDQLEENILGKVKASPAELPGSPPLYGASCEDAYVDHTSAALPQATDRQAELSASRRTCKQLLQRLREPLALLLTDDISSTAALLEQDILRSNGIPYVPRETSAVEVPRSCVQALSRADQHLHFSEAPSIGTDSDEMVRLVHDLWGEKLTDSSPDQEEEVDNHEVDLRSRGETFV